MKLLRFAAISAAFGWAIGMGAAHVYDLPSRLLELEGGMLSHDASLWAFLNMREEDADKVLRAQIARAEACASHGVWECSALWRMDLYSMMAALHSSPSGQSRQREWMEKARAACGEAGGKNCEDRVQWLIERDRKMREGEGNGRP